MNRHNLPAVCRRVRGFAVVLSLGLVVTPHARAASDPLRELQYALRRMHVEAAWARATGAGVAIAIIDTGVDLQHEDLRDRIVGGHDFVDGDDVPQDENGHGTHVSGVAAATAGNGSGVAGVAPGAVILPLRVLDARGTGVETSVAAAIDFAVQRSAVLGLRLVINMSLTDLDAFRRFSSALIEEAVRRAWTAGAVVVAASGNESLPFDDYPAAGPNVLSVGATDERDRRASFSNQGPTVVAPGDKIVSTFWDPKAPNDHRAYASGSGTSMAAPHVAGIAALLLSTGLDNRRTVDRIVETSDDLGPPGKDLDFGYGRVNAARAVGVPVRGTPRSVEAAAQGSSTPPSSAPDKFEEVDAARAAPPRPPVRTNPVPATESPDRTIPTAAAAAAAAAALGGAVWQQVSSRRPRGFWER